MRKDAQAVLLLLIGGTLLKISFTGTYVRYVKPGLLPLLLIAGVVLIAIAGVTLWQVIRAPKQHPPTDDAAGDAGEHSGFEHLAAQDSEPAPKLSSLRAAAVEEPAPKLSALRQRPPSVSQEISRDPTRDVPQDVAQEVTYREFTPGELVAVPVNHHESSAARIDRKNHHPAATVPVDPDPADHGGYEHGEPRIAWLLLLPALALLLFAPPALGSYQASRNGTALSAQANSDFPPLPAGDPVRISMLDYAGRAVFDKGHSLQGRRVTLSGFVIAGPNGQPYLARMVVTCCAADGRPVKVGLAGDLPSTLKPDQWIEIEGSYVDRADKDPVNAETVPYIQVAAVRDIAAPARPYES
ncbi:MAG: hypothetical protein QOE61_4365 [Micromonosporaceae bacterium]|jgi:uncharacterized repeat protein (TIGR03943 family)|nr:hypothetical protein [Micromonosporaceae bacterium]